MIKRLSNKILLRLSVFLVRLLKGRALNSPESVFLELASTCNLSCQGCPVPTQKFRHSRNKKFLEPESIVKLLSLIGNHCNTFVINIWGESFLNKNFFPIIELLSSRKLIISTNLNIQKEQVQKLIQYHQLYGNVHELIISMDGWDQNSYETYYRAGGSFSLVARNLKELQSSSLGKNVILQFLDNGTIEQFETHAREFANKLGMK